MRYPIFLAKLLLRKIVHSATLNQCQRCPGTFGYVCSLLKETGRSANLLVGVTESGAIKRSLVSCASFCYCFKIFSSQIDRIISSPVIVFRRS